MAKELEVLVAQPKHHGLGSGHEEICNVAPRLFTEADFPIGSVAHQGDYTMIRIAALPKSAKPRASRQLGEGSSIGQRHVFTRGEIFDCDADELSDLIFDATKCRVEAKYMGPVLLAPSDPTEHDLDHPEHAHQGYPAGSIIGCVVQRNQDAEDQAVRAQD